MKIRSFLLRGRFGLTFLGQDSYVFWYIVVSLTGKVKLFQLRVSFRVVEFTSIIFIFMNIRNGFYKKALPHIQNIDIFIGHCTELPEMFLVMTLIITHVVVRWRHQIRLIISTVVDPFSHGKCQNCVQILALHFSYLPICSPCIGAGRINATRPMNRFLPTKFSFIRLQFFSYREAPYQRRLSNL